MQHTAKDPPCQEGAGTQLSDDQSGKRKIKTLS